MAGESEEPVDGMGTGAEPLDEELGDGTINKDIGGGYTEGERPECTLNELELEDKFYNYFENGDDSGIFDGVQAQEKEDLFKNLIVSIDSYNKDLIEEIEMISESESEIENLCELKESIKNANKQLCEAAERLSQNDIVSGLGLFYSAKRRGIKSLQALDAIDGGDRMESYSQRMFHKGENYCGEKWVNQAQDAFFEEGEWRDDISSQEIIPWVRDFHGRVYRELASTLLVRTILSQFIRLSLVLIPIVSGVILFSGLLEALAGSRFGTASEAFLPLIYQGPFFLLMFLLGILGSAVNTVRDWPNQLMALQPEQPRLAITRRLIYARLLFGGIAALLAYLLILAGAVVLQPTPGLLIFVAFAAGFTDQLFIASIERSLESKFNSGELSPNILDDEK